MGIENLCNLTKGGEGTSYPNGFTEEHRRNMSKGRIGIKRKPITEETRKKLSESRLKYIKNSGYTGYWKNKKLPEDMKNKMSVSHQDITFTDEHKENIRKALQNVEKIVINVDKLKTLFDLGYSQRKIAKELDCSRKTIKKRLLKYNFL